MAAENFKVKKGLEVGTGATITSDGVNVTGIITAIQFRGDGSGLTGVVGSGSGIIIEDEGSAVGTAGTINFVGSGVTSTLSEGTATVTISSGGLTDVVDDTTPQLGGNLDLNSKFITGSGNIDITGSLDVSGISTTGFLEVGNLNNGRVPYVGSASGRLVDSSNLTFDGSNLFVSGINVTSAGTTSTFGADIVTRNLKATGVSTFTGQSHFSSIVNIMSGLNLQTNLTLDMINSSSSGGLELQNSNNIKLGQNGFPNWEYATFSSGGVDLKYQNQTKLTTTSSGITVPDLNATGTGTFGQIETDGVTLGTNNNTFAAKFVDDAVANFGTDNDLKISHDNTHARITNSTGSIVVTGIISAINAASIQGIDIKAPSGTTNTIIGNDAGANWSGASQCVAVGQMAQQANTNSNFNTSVGVQALGALGSNTGSSYSSNTAVGHLAGSTMTTGSTNTLIGANAGSAINSSANTILGKYDGNQGGLDIRSSDSNIVIADGNSNVRFYINPNGNAGIGTVNPDAAVGSGNTAKLSVGIVSAHQFYGDGSNITGVTASGSGIIVKHDGSTVGTAGTINFSTNLDVTPISAGIVTVTASGGSGSIAGISTTGTSVFNEIVVGTGVTLNARGINAVGTAVTAGRFHADGGSFRAQIGISNQGYYLYNGASTHLAISYSSSANINQFRGNAGGNIPLVIDDFSYITISPKSSSVTLQYAESTKLVTDQAGVKITGVCTATSFSGSGIGLTSLNASNLGSGTIPNGRFPATLPAVSGANLTNLPVPTQITVADESSDQTCNILFTTAATGDLAPKSSSALTYDSNGEILRATLFSGSGASLTNLNASNIGSGTMSASRLTGALPAISGASLTNLPAPTPATSDIQVVYEITNQSSFSYFRFAGNGVDSSANNPDIYLTRGQKYRFINNSGGAHPFQIQTTGGSAYTTGVTYPSGTSASSGNIDFAVRWDAPSQLKYVCTSHGSMVGNIYIDGGEAERRTTANAATGSIANAAAANISITAAKTYSLLKVQTSAAAWVTLYTDSTSRSNDASRGETTDPTPGSGVIAEVITSGAATQILSPGVIGWNNDSTPAPTVYAKVVNKSGSTQAITVTLHYLAMEI